MHTFEGHEQKVMAVIYVDQEQPLCISGDSGGGIFVWGIRTPFGKEPLKKWYEQKDWRYSGIHALCFSKNGYVYTGCGDKSIKAWLLQVTTCIVSLLYLGILHIVTCYGTLVYVVVLYLLI